ncbi:MAG: class I SAM-dependent methyltransferase [Verrucomicrobiota bacterium]|nr:class I SAM-dependent methyltransferase [Verrucomicrobiota bacterium]
MITRSRLFCVRTPHLSLAKSYWKSLIQPGDFVIDATCGNGQDTLFLASLPVSSLFAIDLQEVAIEKAKKNLAGHPVEFFCMSHEAIDQLPSSKPPKLIVYNLGYLPGSDKSIITKKESTLLSVNKSLILLAEGGALSITCYPGHEGGEEEEKALLAWAQELPPHEWEVRHHRWLNRPLRAPSLLWIQKLL